MVTYTVTGVSFFPVMTKAPFSSLVSTEETLFGSPSIRTEVSFPWERITCAFVLRMSPKKLLPGKRLSDAMAADVQLTNTVDDKSVITSVSNINFDFMAFEFWELEFVILFFI